MPPTQALFPVHVNLEAILPQAELLVFGLIVLVAAALLKEDRPRFLAGLASIGVIVAAYSSLSLWSPGDLHFDSSNMLVADRLAILLTVLLCAGGLCTFMISSEFLSQQGKLRGEFYALLLFAIIGMSVMASTLDLIIFFLGLETFSIALYILAGFARTRILSTEASLKYFLLGSFASAFFLYGIALIYGVTGTTDIITMFSSIRSTSLLNPNLVVETMREPLFAVGWALVLIGFAFKIALVPFHAWTPDVYEGAPTPVTAFMSVGVKATAFAALIRIMLMTGLFEIEKWSTIVAALAVLTMTVGNVVAIAQQSLKRMLAYSSIAHAGYLALGIVAGKSLGPPAILFYLISYTLMNLGAFAFVIYIGARHDGDVTLEQCKGLGFRHPIPAVTMMIFMLSLAGVPPTLGFFGKLYLFQTVIQAGDTHLAVIAVLNSAIALFYYLRVVVMMYMHEESVLSPQPSRFSGVMLAAGACAVLIILLGLFPGQVIEIVNRCLPG